MKIKYSRDSLINMGNKINLMPMTDEGWLYLADKLFELDSLSNKYNIDTYTKTKDGGLEICLILK